MVSSFGAGSEAAQKFKEQYERTTESVGMGSKAMADAAAKQAEAAQAAADKSIAAVEKTRQAAQTAAAQAQVAADKTEAAQAKAAAAATAAADATARAAESGAAADIAAADQAVTAAARASNAAKLAAEQQATAFAKAGDAALAEAAQVAESVKLQEVALAKGAAAAEAAAGKRNAADMAASAGAAKMAAGSVAALAVVGGASLEMAGKFEKSTELLVTAGGESQDNLNRVRDGILNVAQATGVSAEQLSEGMYTVEKATFRGADGLNVLKAAAEGAAAENVDMGTMTNALTSIMMSYHLTSDKAVATTNELVAGAGAAKTTMQEYAGSLSTVLPVASAAGISFEQVGGAIATLTQHGTSAAESTQELANTIRALQAPNNVAVSAMQQLGINSQDVAANLGTRGLTGTIQLVTDAIASHLGPNGLVMVDVMKKSATGAADLHTMMNQMSPTLRAAAQGFLDGNVSAKAFSTEIKGLGAEGDAQGKQFMSLAQTVAGYNDQIKHGGPEAQTAAAALKNIMGGATGMNTALMLGGENMKTFTDKTEEMSQAAKQSGSDISTNAATQETLAATTARLKQQFEALMITLGTALAPAMKDTMNGIMELVNWFRENKGAAEALGIGILALVGGFTAWVVISKTWAATSAISTLATKMLTAEFWSLSAAMDANPLGVVVMALAALVAGLVWAYNNVGWFKDGVDAAFKWIQEAVGNVVDWIVNTAVPWLIGAWQNVVSFFQTSVGMFKDFGTNTYGMFHDFVTNTVGMFADFVNHTVGMFSDFINNTVGMFSDFGKSVGDVLAAGWKIVSDGAKWLYDTILKPIFDGIVLAGKFMATVIGTLVVAPIVIAFNLLAAAGKWMWENAIKPAWDNMMKGAKMVGDFLNVVVFTPIGNALKEMGREFQWVYDNAIKPAWEWIQKAAGAAWNWIRDSVFKPMSDGINAVGQFMKMVYENYIKPAWENIRSAAEIAWNWVKAQVINTIKMDLDAIGAVFKWVGNLIGTVWEAIRSAAEIAWNWVKAQVINTINYDMNALGALFKWVYENFIKPAWENIRAAADSAWSWVRDNVFKPLSDGIDGIGKAFDATGDFISKAWNKIKEAAAAPVRFIVDNVYTNGIEKVWNQIASSVGLDMKLPDVKAGFATGGIMPGYSPGVDNQVIAVSGGEAIMRPEWTQAIGAEKVHAMNAMARSGNSSGIRQMMGFADGGIAGFLSDTAKNVGNFMSNPLGGITDLIKGPVQQMLGGTGGGNFGQMIAQFPMKIIGSLGDKATQLVQGLTQHAGPAGTPVDAGTAGAGVQQWAGLVSQALSMMGQPSNLLGTTLRRMNQESGGNPNAINNWDSNALAGIPSKGLMQVIDPTFRANAMPGYNTNIYDPMSNILASMKYAIGRYGSLAGAYNQAGGYAMGGITPKLYDRGGYLPTGTSLIQNNTGAPERVIGPGQTGLEGTTIVLEIPELGGRLEAKIKDVVAGTHATINRSLRNSAGVRQGGF
jgi:hypothetical protein